MPLAEAYAARISFRNGSRGVARTALAGPSVFRGGAISLRRDSGGKERHSLGAFERQIARKISARNHRGGLRVFRLRQRRVDGYLFGEQRQMRFLYAGPAAAQRTLQKQPVWQRYRRHRESWSGRRRIRPGRSGGRL